MQKHLQRIADATVRIIEDLLLCFLGLVLIEVNAFRIDHHEALKQFRNVSQVERVVLSRRSRQQSRSDLFVDGDSNVDQFFARRNNLSGYLLHNINVELFRGPPLDNLGKYLLRLRLVHFQKVQNVEMSQQPLCHRVTRTAGLHH